MIDFFHEGSKIGLSIGGWDAAIFLLFILISVGSFALFVEFVFRLSGVSLLRAIIVWLGVRKWLKQNIPTHYSTKHNFVTIKLCLEHNLPMIYETYGRNLYSVYVEIRARDGLIPPYLTNWTNDFLIADKRGDVISESLTIKMKSLEEKIDLNELKSLKREDKLKKLGI